MVKWLGLSYFLVFFLIWYAREVIVVPWTKQRGYYGELQFERSSMVEFRKMFRSYW